jgi:DNA-binding XRE family transcriptional regulator
MKGIAQEVLALAAEVDRSYPGRVERGEKQPSLIWCFVLQLRWNVSQQI